MIKLIDKGPDASLIEFRPKNKKVNATITRPLVYGHECEWCGNTIQALFMTPELIKLDRYEETRVISQGDKNEGQLLKIVPNPEDTESAYKVDFYDTPGGKAQLIRLKNHVIIWKGMNGNQDLHFEVGERCCKYVGIPCMNESSYVWELAMLCKYPTVGFYVGKKTKIPVPLWFLEKWKPGQSWNSLDFRISHPVGNAKKMVLLNRALVKGATVIYPFSDLFEQWDKQVDQDVALGLIKLPVTPTMNEDEDESPF